MTDNMTAKDPAIKLGDNITFKLSYSDGCVVKLKVIVKDPVRGSTDLVICSDSSTDEIVVFGRWLMDTVIWLEKDALSTGLSKLVDHYGSDVVRQALDNIPAGTVGQS